MRGSLALEPWYYSSQACVHIDVVPDSGHDLNLQINAPNWFATALEWAGQYVGAPTTKPQPGCGDES
jgi:hypothetical protein